MPLGPLISSINSGEFSPRMEARTDFERYPNAAKMCRNFVLFPQGGIARRPGTRFVKEVKDSADDTRLIGFEFSETDSYMIEHGDGYMRFYRRQGRLDVENTDAAVTNGTFTSNITNWTNKSTGSAAIAHDATNGRLQLTGDTNGIAWAEQAITIGAGHTAKEHVLRFKIDGFGGGTVGFQVGTATGLADILSETELGPGYHSIGFTPGATTFYVQFRNKNSPTRNMFVDDVSFIVNAPMELVSPYGSADLAQLQYFQAADVVYLLHPNYAPRRLERRGHRRWSVAEAWFTDGPYLSINDGFDFRGEQLFDNPLFENGMVGWSGANSTNDSFVVHSDSGKFVELDPGQTTPGEARLEASTTTISGHKHTAHVLVIAEGPVGVKFGTALGGGQYIDTTVVPGWHTFEFTTSATALHVQFYYSGSLSPAAGRAAVGGCLVYNQNARMLEASAVSGSVTITAHGFSPFTAADVGRLLRLEWPGREPGYGVITAYSSATSVTMLVLRELASVAPTESWRFGAWGGDQGYPKVVSFFDGRSVFANTEQRPHTLWFSQSGGPQNMRPDSFEDGATTVEDDDAIVVTFESTKINPVLWLSGQRQLMSGTAGGEWIVTSNGAVITPSDRGAKQHAAVPCASVKALEINQTTLFAGRAQRDIHDLGFSFEQDSFLATDLTILADHIFRSPVQEMIYQRSPYSIIWCRRADGRLATLSYNQQHQVLGWAQTIIGGSFGSGDAVVESIATIPGSDDENQIYPSDERNEIWMIVKRTINGATKRYVEFIEYFFDGPLREDYDTEVAWQDAMRDAQKEAFYVDSGLTYDGVAVSTVSGLDHLEGETVKVLTDGRVQPNKIVSGGSITFNGTATKVHVGLPYKHRYESLKLAPETRAGSGVNKIKIITSVGMILLDTAEFKFTTVDYDEDGRRQHELDTIKLLREHMGEDEAIPLFTGEHTPTTPGVYSRDSRIYIEGDNPLPFTLLGLAPQMEIRDT